MFRTTIRASNDVDVPAVVAALRREAERAGVPAINIALLTEAVQGTLTDLIARGRDMAGLKTVVNAEKTFRDAAYEVTLKFGAGGRRSMLGRVADMFRGR